MSFLNLMRNRLKPKEVNDALMDVEGRVLPVTTSASTGQILKLTGEGKVPNWGDEYSYTPPAYSETETATGQKWIDGKDIYRLVLVGTFPVVTTSGAFTIAENLDINLISARGTTLLDGFQMSIPYFNSTNYCGLRLRNTTRTGKEFIGRNRQKNTTPIRCLECMMVLYP